MLKHVSQILSIFMVIGTMTACEGKEHKERNSPLVREYVYKNDIYDADFWEGFDKEEEPYEHDWLHIPDFINKTNVEFWFNLTHHFLEGVDRGVYMNDSIIIHPDCFGKKYVKKINELAAMFKDNFFYNIMPALSIFYQLFYMGTQQCSIDQTVNDLFVFCWNEGCELGELWEHTYMNFLYMTRALLDSAIVWFEGLPEGKEGEEEKDEVQWHELSRQTGETVSEIVKEITNFSHQKQFKKRQVILHKDATVKKPKYTPQELQDAQQDAMVKALDIARKKQAAAKMEEEANLDKNDDKEKEKEKPKEEKN